MSEKQKKPFSKAILYGEVVNKKQGETKPFKNQETGWESSPKPYLEFDVKVSDDSRIRCRVMNSRNQPTHVNDLARYLNDGDYVKVIGSIDYRVDKRDASKVYITVRPFSVDKVDAGKNPAQAKFVLQGEVTSKLSDVVDGRPVLNFNIEFRNEINGRVYESVYPVVAYDELAGDLHLNINDGYVVLVVGDLVQRLLKDEYDFIKGNITELEVKEVREVISEGGGVSGSDDVPF